MSSKDQKERFHFLDGIRGIAAFMIVIHHSLTSAIASALAKTHIPYLGDLFAQTTQSGVELFFVLSGVVLLRPYLRGNRTMKIGDYLFRRLKRIYPPYFFALVFGAAVIWFIGTYPTWYNEKAIHTTFSWPETFREIFIFNFHATYYNLAWWSLQIEVLFYLFVPFVILYFPRNKTITNTRVILSVVVTQCLFLGLQLLSTRFTWQFYSYTYDAKILGESLEYPVCFLMGIFLAARDFNTKEAKIMLAAGFLLVLTGLIVTTSKPPDTLVFMSVMHAGYGVFYAGIITLAFKLDAWKKLLSNPVMVWLGERSYSLFLIHFSVFYLTDNMVSRITSGRDATYGILTRGLGIPFAVFCAMLLFHFVERKQAKGLLTEKAFWPWQARRVMEEANHA